MYHNVFGLEIHKGSDGSQFESTKVLTYYSYNMTCELI